MTLEGYNEYTRCIEYIRVRLNSIYPYCNSTWTIESSNIMFNRYLRKVKQKVFKTIAVDKKEVIQAVNNYFNYER